MRVLVSSNIIVYNSMPVHKLIVYENILFLMFISFVLSVLSYVYIKNYSGKTLTSSTCTNICTQLGLMS